MPSASERRSFGDYHCCLLLMSAASRSWMRVPQLSRAPKGCGAGMLILEPHALVRDAVAKPRILIQMNIWRWMGRRRLQGAVTTCLFLLLKEPWAGKSRL